MKILLTVAYDGTSYCGWQRQLNGVSVQQVLEDALREILQAPELTVTGASRTDAGVHALGQRAAFSVTEMKIPVDKICRVLNGRLPADISVRAASEVSEDFNPRFAAKRKTYRYSIFNQEHGNPLLARYSWHVTYPLDVPAMREAASHLEGTHDFAAFCAAGGSAKTTERTIFSLTVIERESEPASQPGLIDLTVTGDGFLYNMVRIIAGTLVYVGAGKISAKEMPGIILSGNRARAGITAPPHGLTLMEVEY